MLYHADKPGERDTNEGKSVSETSFVHPQKVGLGQFLLIVAMHVSKILTVFRKPQHICSVLAEGTAPHVMLHIGRENIETFSLVYVRQELLGTHNL